eukprot:CAMPEP_0119504484 /NCGR_PEP_ID=MMETSP1344-20130328/25336_1 /TAXON_ID=236787 /ORGANISM="Florenciella parvula, Strain CCMP2471" /LENGTH=153 /DNA_ID=CAMNT_0007540867 /DNA_START=220 /DNA_END=677 /DNA_ORIENTATION=+
MPPSRFVPWPNPRAFHYEPGNEPNKPKTKRHFGDDNWIHPGPKTPSDRARLVREREAARAAAELEKARGSDVPLGKSQKLRNKKLKDESIRKYIALRSNHRDQEMIEQMAQENPAGFIYKDGKAVRKPGTGPGHGPTGVIGATQDDEKEDEGA